MAGFLKRVNRTKVPPELLGEVMEMHANLPPEAIAEAKAQA